MVRQSVTSESILSKEKVGTFKWKEKWRKKMLSWNNSKAILRATLAHGVFKVVNMVTNGHTNVGTSGQKQQLYVFSKFVWWQIMFSALMLQNVWVHHVIALLISSLKSLKSMIWKWVLSSDFTDVYFCCHLLFLM